MGRRQTLLALALALAAALPYRCKGAPEIEVGDGENTDNHGETPDFRARVLGWSEAAGSPVMWGFDGSSRQLDTRPNAFLKLLGTPDFDVGAWVTGVAGDGSGAAISRLNFYRFGGETIRIQADPSADGRITASLTLPDGSVRPLRQGKRVGVSGGLVWYRPLKEGAPAVLTIDQPRFSLRVEQPCEEGGARRSAFLDVTLLLRRPEPQLAGLLGGTLPAAST